MAPYSLISVLLTGLTTFGWVNDPSQASTPLAQTQEANRRLNWVVAQDSGDTEDQPTSSESNSPFPIGLILLAFGGITITGSAVAILFRLWNKPTQDSETPENSAQEESESPSMNPPPLFQQPTPVPSVEPAAHSNSHSPQTQNHAPLDSTEPVDTLKPSAQTETGWLEDAPRYSKLDPIEQWIAILQETNPTHRSKAIWELGQHGDSRAVQPLVDLFLSSDSKQRSLILASLSEINIRALKPVNRALLFSLQDDNVEVRKNAIRDLSRIYDLITQMSQLLQRAADDPDPEVQETAQWAINKLARLRPSLPSSQQK